MRIVGLGRGLFAIASAGLAILSLAYRDFAPLGQWLPARTPWQETWGYGPAILLLAASVGVCFSRTALPSALAIVGYQAFWAVTYISPILSKPLVLVSWYGFCQALTALAGASILYAVLRWQPRESAMPIPSQGSVRAAQILFGLTCVFYGWSHFTYADYTASMVPNWLPGRLGFAYVTGLGHIAAGIGVVFAILPRLAATLEAMMMSLFCLLVWVPSFFTQPRPQWATPPENQWSELVVTMVLLASAWIVAISLRDHRWVFASKARGALIRPRS
jgi:uncharacterized membrane protein